MRGKVKFYNADRGFGFIAPDGGGQDVFVHASSLPDGLDGLRDGDVVAFDVGANRRTGKTQAVGVRLVD